MTDSLLISIISIIILFLFLYVTYRIAKKTPEFSVAQLALCFLFITFDIEILTTSVQFYLIWKLYFSWSIKHDLKEKIEENGDDKIDK